jgi:hypothetical protein
MNKKWLVTALPLALLVASCTDMPTEAPRAAPGSGLSFYVAPAGDVVVYGTEVGANMGDLWAVNLTAGTTHLMYTWTDPSGDNNSPNAVAFDAVNQRMYFSVNDSDGSPFSGTPDKLYMFDVTGSLATGSPGAEPVLVGTLPRTAYAADFYGGSYYYIPNVTADLIRVNFKADGHVDPDNPPTTVCPNFRTSGTPSGSRLFFGDIAIRDGVVYGSMNVDNDTRNVRFFTVNLNDCAYQETVRPERTMLQLAWVDGVLYGHETDTGNYFTINPANGARLAQVTEVPTTPKLSDIAGTYTPEIIPDANLTIVKLTNDSDNNDHPTGPLVPAGSTVTWTYEVTNLGNVTLTNVMVTDDNGTPGNPADDFQATCPETTLAPGETMICSATGTAIEGQYVNWATASGYYNGTEVTAEDPDRYFGEAAGAVLLIIDEDGIDNGLHVNRYGNLNYPDGTSWMITPSGPSFWTASEVNDDLAAYGFRNVLRYFASSANNFGRTITVRTGQTGDEGWFAPNCIPRKWLNSSVSSGDNRCAEGAERTTGIDNLFFSGKTPFTGAPSSRNIPQSRLDKIPHVRPLRALGIQTLVGQDVCALVYDSDISINYDHGTSLGVNGNLQGATLGIAAFRVESAHTLNNFSSSTLPQVRITVLDPSQACRNFRLYDAPVPNSSSVPNDRVVLSTFNFTGSSSYRGIASENVFN